MVASVTHAYIRIQVLIFRFESKVLGVVTMQRPSEQETGIDEAATDADAREYLLAEVDFKWLMAGEGRWIDTARLHIDPSYAVGLIRWALVSPSFALRESAALLQTQLYCTGLSESGSAPSDALRVAPEATFLYKCSQP